jgi:epoxide hydrolase-like predicted phosphatase
MIKAIVFDWGGVLMRTLDPQPRRELEAEYGLPLGSVDGLVFGSLAWTRCQVGRLTDQEFWADFGRQRDLSPDQVSDFRRRFFAGDRLDNDMVAFISSLRPQLKTALLSNFSARLRTLLGQYGLDGVFDAVIISGEEGIAKPDARIYHIACQRLSVLPGEAVFVDDFVDNVEGAQRAGLQAVHFTSTVQMIQALRRLGVSA